MNGKLRNMASVYLFKGDEVLLLFRQGSRVVDHTWVGSAGGHFEEYELNDARACALREMQEELGINVDDIEGLSLRYVTLRRTKGEIRQNYYFFANLKPGADENLTSNEGRCQWFSLQEIAALEMPYSAKYVMEHYCKIGRHTSEMYAGIADGTRVVFTGLPEY